MATVSPVVKWKRMITDEDANGIMQQLVHLVNDMTVFKLYRDDCNRQGAKPLSRSDLAFELMFRAHIKAVHLALRAQNESNYTKQNGRLRLKNRNKHVSSLTVLLEAMRDEGSAVTRKAFFKSRNIPYDANRVECAQHRWLISNPQATGWISALEPYKTEPDHIRYLHDCFDKLAGTTLENRSPNDTISPRVIKRLIKKVEQSTKISKHFSDKFYAHNATSFSRSVARVNSMKMSYVELDEAVATLLAIAKWLRSFLASDYYVFMQIGWEPYATHNMSQKYMEWVSDQWKRYDGELKIRLQLDIFV